jgi:hypothetical protein
LPEVVRKISMGHAEVFWLLALSLARHVALRLCSSLDS